MQQQRRTGSLSDQEKLFVSLAEGVSHTMLQLARLSEAAKFLPPRRRPEQWRTVHDISSASLQLLEGYTHLLRLHGGTAEPHLEPVAITSLLHDTVHILAPYAKQHEIEIMLDMPSRLEPVVSDRAILQSALLSLGQVFISAQAETDEPGVLRLGAHRGRAGIITGWYGQGYELTAWALRRARRLHGAVHQPFHELTSGAASGVFVADGLLEAVSSGLHVARYHKVQGLAATLPMCRQLQLV